MHKNKLKIEYSSKEKMFLLKIYNVGSLSAMEVGLSIEELKQLQSNITELIIRQQANLPTDMLSEL